MLGWGWDWLPTPSTCSSPSGCLGRNGSGARSRNGWGAGSDPLIMKNGPGNCRARSVFSSISQEGHCSPLNGGSFPCSAKMFTWHRPGRGGDQGVVLVAPQGEAVAPDAPGVESLDIGFAGVAHQGRPVAEDQDGVIHMVLALLEPGAQAGVDSVGPFLHLKSRRPSK